MLLVAGGVIAELAPRRGELPSVAAHHVPVQLVDSLVLLAKERVVEDAEGDFQQIPLPANGARDSSAALTEINHGVALNTRARCRANSAWKALSGNVLPSFIGPS